MRIKGAGASPASGNQGFCITFALLATSKNRVNVKVGTNLNIEKGRKKP